MLQTIRDRRSIRQYSAEEVPAEALREIVRAGMLAPSSKNRQPWKFVIAAGDAKASMVSAMRRGLERERREPLLPGSAEYRAGAERTAAIMERASAVICVVNTLGLPLDRPLSPEERVYEICNAQSIGAAMENMTLAATELGLGSLWICDTFFAHRELSEWLSTPGEPYAAMAVGYKAEAPFPRPRKSWDSVVEWRE